MSAGDASKIRFRGVGKTFAARGGAGAEAVVALADVDLEVRRGELLVLVGPSGCGKSTLLEMAAGLATPNTGAILIDDRPIAGPALDRGVVFQQYALFPWRSALDNVAMGLESKGLPPAARRRVAEEHLALVGLAGFERHYPHELSGGMRQRVAIARSLAYEPDVLLMDEPFAALDAQTRESLQAELLRIWRRSGKTILFVTHGIDEAVYLGQRVAVMSSRPGRIKEIVTIPARAPEADEEARSRPAFGALRHQIWTLLRDEVSRAEDLEKERRGRSSRPGIGAGGSVSHV
jgi:NitT/TauT family transport system ATP-binding protein